MERCLFVDIIIELFHENTGSCFRKYPEILVKYHLVIALLFKLLLSPLISSFCRLFQKHTFSAYSYARISLPSPKLILIINKVCRACFDSSGISNYLNFYSSHQKYSNTVKQEAKPAFILYAKLGIVNPKRATRVVPQFSFETGAG